MPPIDMKRAEQLLAQIAQRNPCAAELGRQVLEQRYHALVQWIDVLEAADESLQGPFGQTRLATIAEKEIHKEEDAS